MNEPVPPPRLRIAAISEHLALGGSTTFLLNLGAGLREQAAGFMVYNLTPRQPLARSFAAAGVAVAPPPPDSIYEDRIAHVLHQVADQQPGVVLASLGTLALECLRYAPPGVLRFAVAHTDSPIDYATIRPYADLLDGLVAVSPEIGRKMQADPAFAGLPVRVIPYGVAMPGHEPPARPLDPACPRLLYAGRLDRGQKRVDLFPEIWERIKAARPRIHWTIAGDGPERAWLQEALKPDAMHTLTFTGSLAYEEMGPLMESHDLFLLYSAAEGLPLSLLEAMGRGMAPVVSDLASGIRECVTADCGIRVPPGQPAAYAEALTGLLADPARIGALSRAARAQARAHYSRQAMTQRWLELFQPAPDCVTWAATAIRPARPFEKTWWRQPAFRPLRRLAARARSLP